MVHSVHLASQFLSDWVHGTVMIHLSSQVVPSGEVLEPVQIIPVTSSTATGIVIHNLNERTGLKSGRGSSCAGFLSR